MCPDVRCPAVSSDCETIEYIVFQYDYEVRGRVITVRCESCEYCIDVPRSLQSATGHRRRRFARRLAARSSSTAVSPLSFCLNVVKSRARLPKVIWKQAASPPLQVADSLMAAAHNRLTVFVIWR